jgi:hypothetical protein
MKVIELSCMTFKPLGISELIQFLNTKSDHINLPKKLKKHTIFW